MKLKMLAVVTAMSVLPLMTQAAQAEYWSEQENENKRFSTSYDEQYYDDLPEYVDQARVVKVKPLYRTVEVSEPEYRCQDEVVHHSYTRDPDGIAGTIVGGAVGGVLGHQVGGGSGKDVATVVGALIGAAVGHDAASRPHTRRHADVEQRCTRHDRYVTERELTGYHVQYRYQGRNYWTKMSHRPGKVIDVRVSIEPLED